MIDNEFDGFVSGKLGDHEVPVPAGLWDKLTNAQFDQFIGNKLKDNEAAVPDALWGKITDTQFDSFISNKLTGYEAAVPAGLWEKVDPQREDDDRGGFAWFRNTGRTVTTALVLLGLLGGYFWYQSSQETNAVNRQSSIVNGNGNNATQKNQKVTTDAQANGSDTKQHDVTTTPENQQKDLSSVTSTEKANAANSVNGQWSMVNNNNAAQNNVTIDPAKQVNRQSSIVNGSNAAQNNATINAGNTDQANNFDNNYVEPYQFYNLQSGTTIPYARESRMTNLADKQLTIGNHTSRLKSSIIVCPSDKGLNRDWFLEAYLSPDFAFSKVSSNGASQQYMDRKDSSESMNPGFTAGIRLVKPITDNILVKAGLQYSQMNQKYVYRTENEIKTITVVSLRTIIRAPGDTVIVRDTSVLQQVGFKNNTVINRFRSLDVPITVGYQFGNDDLKIGINAGVVVNMSSWYEGVTLDTTLATVPITKGIDNSIYKNRIGLGLVGGISITKKLSDDLQIFAEPYFRFNLSNTTTPNAPFNQKFSVGGLSLGVRLNLNRQ
jgi:hypothetical protein